MRARPIEKFPQFRLLPAEVRLQIYEAALPDPTEPTLFVYKYGCWDAKPLTRDEIGARFGTGDNVDTDLHLGLEYHYDRLDHVLWRIPLVDVNREARACVLAWAARHGFSLHWIPPQTRRDKRRALLRGLLRPIIPRLGLRWRLSLQPRPAGGLVFVRPFVKDVDVLYVPRRCWTTFAYEYSYRMAAEDFEGKHVTTLEPITRVAFSSTLTKSAWFTAIYEEETEDRHLKDIFIVTGDLPAAMTPSCSHQPKRRLERVTVRLDVGGTCVVEPDKHTYKFLPGKNMVGDGSRSVVETLAYQMMHLQSRGRADSADPGPLKISSCTAV